MSAKDDIVARVVAGESLTLVGRDYGVTRQRISQIVHAAGIRLDGRRPPKRYSERDATITLNLMAGRPARELAAEYRLHVSNIRAIGLRHGARLYQPAPEHGISGYNHRGCRCPICRQANNHTRHKRRQPRVDRRPCPFCEGEQR